MVPIAGVILAIVMTLELIQMITDRNNLHDVDTWMIFKWVFKSAAAILLVTNTWNLVMGVFDMAQAWWPRRPASSVRTLPSTSPLL